MKTDIASPDSASLVERVIKSRRSTRHFTDAKISKSILLKLVEAGIWAPSGSNWQNQRFLIVDSHDQIDHIGRIRFVWPYKNANQNKIRKTHPAGIIGNAKALIVVFSDSYENDRRGIGEYYLWESLEIQNCAASIENILLLATSMGIANCWISASDNMNYTRLLSQKTWRQLFPGQNIPGYFKMQGIILLGYPKATDEAGFPTGERMHGATIWKNTDRKPLEYYLIKEKDLDGSRQNCSPTFLQKTLLHLASHSIQYLLRCVRFLDRSIHRIEINRVINRLK